MIRVWYTDHMNQAITIKVRNSAHAKRHLYAYHVCEFDYYSGTVVPNPKWAAKDVLCLSTGDPQMPFRMVERSAIVGEMGISIQPEPRVRTHLVAGSKPGSTYTVTQDGENYVCSCVGYGFRKWCKHVTEVKNKA